MSEAPGDKADTPKPMTAAELSATDANSAVIVRDQGILENGRPYWIYIAVKPSMYQKYLRAVAERRMVRFDEYGAILKYGFEMRIPSAIQEEMEQRYQFDEKYMDILAQKVKEAQIAFLKNKENQRLGDLVAMLRKNKPNGES